MARIQILTVCLVVSGFCAGCGKAKADHNDPATSYVVDGAKEDLPAIKAALAGPKPDDALIKCAARMANLDALQTAEPELAAEYKRLCAHDIPFAIIKVEVEKAEAARKAKPDAKPLSECYSAYFDQSVEDLAKAGTADAASKALVARFAAACPK